MPYFTTSSGEQIYYKDWGKGQPVVFSNGWPLSADAWESQMLFLAEQDYRCISHDRRGHGRSSQPWYGNDMDCYAADLHELIEWLDLKSAVLVGHSTGGGELTRYLANYGTGRVAKAVLVGAVTPSMAKTAANPNGLSDDVFDTLKKASLLNRGELYRALASGPLFGFNRDGAVFSESLVESFCAQEMQAGHPNTYDCINAFFYTDFSGDLGVIDIPVLIILGDDDQKVPFESSVAVTHRLLKNSELKIYPGGLHAPSQMNTHELNADLLEFLGR